MIVTVWALAALGVAGWAVVKWRDRPLGTTICRLAVAWVLLLVPVSAIFGAGTVLLVMMLTLIFVVPAIALVVEMKQRRVRLQTRQLAIAGGKDTVQAQREYRRAPRGPATILAIYMVVAITWVLIAVGVSAATDNADLASKPMWPVPLGPGEPVELPWWMAVMAGLAAASVIHAVVNTFRRS
ncbi:MAG: hypothetical protein M3467_03325 [Actinomycetota bacterium]|nr:hypothetical protein [Actinomycetota bacterium]